MSACKFSSCLAAQMKRFINLRRLSGTDYHSQTRLLEYFDRFRVQQGFNRSHRAHQPYIYNSRQLWALLAAASRLLPLGSLRPHTYRTPALYRQTLQKRAALARLAAVAQ